MHFRPEPLVVALVILLLLQASSLEGVGFPSSARLAVTFLAITARSADRNSDQDVTKQNLSFQKKKCWDASRMANMCLTKNTKNTEN